MPRKNRTKYRSIDQDLQGMLPDEMPAMETMSREELSAIAKASNAVHKWRGIPDGEVLLRAVLLWGVLHFSFRSTAGWLQDKGIASVCDDTVRYRCSRVEPFLLALLAQSWRRSATSWSVSQPDAPHRILIFDATSLEGADLKLHVVFNLLTQNMAGISIGDADSGESTERLNSNDSPALLLADAHYGNARQILIATQKGYHVLARTSLGRLHPRDPESEELLEIAPILDLAQTKGCASQSIVLHSPNNPNVGVRLVVCPLREEAANRARAKLRETYRRKYQKAPSADALYRAGFIALVTTLPEAWAKEEVLMLLYRSRWQVELFFKRAKSIVKLNAFGQEGDALARVRVLSKLLVVALMMRRMMVGWVWTENNAARTLSLWAQCRQIYENILTQLKENGALLAGEVLDEEVLWRLSERPRKRQAVSTTIWSMAWHDLDPLPPITASPL